MTDRWRRVEELYHEALKRPEDRRSTFLNEACAGDEVLRREVESLLVHEPAAAGFLAAPALEVAAEVMAEEVMAEEQGSFPAGQHLGPYTIHSRLGAGGMGEVYRARDSKLGRDVAIKVLSHAFITDPDRLARFRREARMLAALNHPNIGAIYGFEEFDGTPALVLELVDGDTLAQRIAKGPLPIAEALRISAQVAEALETAHERGIVHRDLKPANIKITPDGVVKVLDFGIAKAAAGEAAATSRARSPTVTIGDTREGCIVGTPAYMSPEQARGQVIDKRADIWAFGCVLYEMLTGRAAFAGDTLSDTIVAILDREPDWTALPVRTSSSDRRLLRRCLEKDPKRRLHDIADARIEINDALTAPSDASNVGLQVPPGVARHRTRERMAWVIAAACLAGLAVALTLSRAGSGERTPADLPRYSTSIVLPTGVRLWPGNPPGRFAISPDGRRLALVASDPSGVSLIWVRPLHSRVAQPLSGTEGATYPFWSPDSRFIAFLAQGKLKKIEAVGGQPVTLCDASFGSPGTWNREDVILFTPSGNSPLYRVSAAAGSPVQATTLDAGSGDVQHSYPSFLPDDRHFLYFVVGSQAGNIDPRGVYLGSLDSKEPGKLILKGGSNARYANGHLIFLRNGALLAQPFDVDRLELGGQPLSLVEQIDTGTSLSDVTGAFTASQTGELAYQTGTLVRSQLTWFNRAGTQLGTLGEQADYVDVALSPDDKRVAVSVMDLDRGTHDLWIFDVARRLGERFTYESGDDFGPNWSRPRGDRIFFSSQRNGSIQLYEKPSSGSGSETLLLEDALGKFNPSPSEDGRFLVYVGGGGIIGRSDLWVLPLFGERKPAPFLESRFLESQGQFSPDGRWIAFMSSKSGQREVYVTPFPGRGIEHRVSTAGGSFPRWTRNGKEVFYLAPDNTLRVTPVNGKTSHFEVGTGRQLFAIRPRLSRLDAYPYGVTSDGLHILVNSFVEEVTPPITLIVNWHAAR